MNKMHILVILGIMSYANLFAQDYQELLLYENTMNDFTQEVKTYDKNSQLTHLSGIVVPRLFIYRPKNPCGTGLIICPGGGYSKLNVENARFIAERLTQWGMTIFVLIYRLPEKDFSPEKSVNALRDVQEALRLVHGKASEWNISTDKIGLWGSSAGGHLAAMAATHHTTSFSSEEVTADLRPDFLILAWPVISFRKDLAHQGSLKNLLGDSVTDKQREFYSPDEQVNGSVPSTFIVHADDDRSVSALNSIKFYEGLKRANVPAELHIYETGGHGFGIAPELTDSWLSQLANWLRKKEMI